MTDNHSGKSRVRRSERARSLYVARTVSPAGEEVALEAAAQQELQGAEAQAEASVQPYGGYTPNASGEGLAGVEKTSHPQEDLSAYYRRGGSQSPEGEEAEPAFAPPPKLDFLGFDDKPVQPAGEVQSNVYRPREATWADTARRDILSMDGVGYEVREEAENPAAQRRRRRRRIKKVLVGAAVLVVLAGGGWLMRDRIGEWLNQTGIVTQPEATFTVMTTPQPISGYDAAPALEIADTTRTAISRLSGTVQMDIRAVTDTHVLTSNLRPDGTYDFYLFTAAEGRLLCYFEGLSSQGMFPQAFGGFYVDQKPYLVAVNGSALVRTADLEASYGSELRLHPMYNGWSIIQSEKDGSANYINAGGQLFSTLWFARAYPFTGQSTVAYVDTGSTAESDQRYLLYVLGQDGTMSRWLATPDMEDLVASACGMAYMNTGEMYRLPDTSAPLVTSPEVHAYLDCDAMVVRDPESGKYGLFVQGEQHYDFVYDSIRPVASDITWAEKTLEGDGGTFTVHAVTGAAYPQPLSHSFVLEREGKSEYVALSTQSCYPIRLEGEF